MNSKICIGTIDHRRFKPVEHSLSYPVYMYAFDLDELPRLNHRYPFFGYNRFGITSIHDTDYLQPGSLQIKQKLIQLFEDANILEPISSVITFTSARYFNYVFNPVNFHYCYSSEAELVGLVAEVHNTYGERHPYLLTEKIEPSNGWFAQYASSKVFHVSPFNKIEGIYRFYFSDLSERLEVRIELVCEGKKVMEAVLKTRAISMTPRNHIKTLLRHPFVPHLSIPRIYAHAFKLYFQKKLTFYDKPEPISPMTIPKTHPNLMESIFQRLILSAFRKISTGCLIMELPDKQILKFGREKKEGSAVIIIRSYHFFSRVAIDGEIGFGEAYMHGEWDTPNLVGVLKLLIHNRDQFSDGNMMLSILTRIKENLAHDKRKNTIENTPQNIADHYDLSNELYELFLDRQMIYSCGIFEHPEDSLEDAQVQKMTRILEKAQVNASHHLLEIGCGWGGFAIFAAKKTGCRVTGITVSKAQYEKACQRIKKEGLEDKISILLQDYRHTQGTYDRIVSIEMIEAVGPQFLGLYFKQCYNLLTHGGIMVFQAITITDDRYDRYCKERDWIQKHIFPGGHLPCLKVLNETIAENTAFNILEVQHIGPHYATTLSHWRDRFLFHKQEIEKMGFDREFLRKWTYYFSICEAGFETSTIDDIQMALTR